MRAKLNEGWYFWGGEAALWGKIRSRNDSNSPVFSLISQSTLNRAGFILWQFRACFLQENKKKKSRNCVQKGGKKTVSFAVGKTKRGGITQNTAQNTARNCSGRSWNQYGTQLETIKDTA